MSSTAERRTAGTPLFAALMRPECYPHPVGTVRVLETHISWVLLTGTYAYKIKKPVNLGFADFSTLGLRQYYCEEEARLNRRFAPSLYLDVVPIRGEPGAPRIDGEGPVLDYAVRMREFPQDALADRALAVGAFGAPGIDVLAGLIARFHAGTPAAPADGRLGRPAAVLASARQNFEQILPLLTATPDDGPLRALQLWTEHEFAVHATAFAARLQRGFVRDCHGDLHLGNIVLLDGQPVPFDCIEFNDELRWIDVMSEIAFLAMDLEHRGRRDLAWRFINRYLEESGDYAGLDALRFYLVYRALVRAKVNLMQSHQTTLGRSEKSQLLLAFRGYLALAGRYAAPRRATLVLAHGLTGSGKTTATQPLIEMLGAVRLRSDLERKRLHGLAPLAPSGSGLDGGIYTPAASAATYQRLAVLSQQLLHAGYPVVVDAAFLKRTEREAFRAVAERAGAAFRILAFQAPLEVLRARVESRRARADDASEADLAVLERQIETREPLTPAEMSVAILVDGSRPAAAAPWTPLVEQINQAAER